MSPPTHHHLIYPPPPENLHRKFPLPVVTRIPNDPSRYPELVRNIRSRYLPGIKASEKDRCIKLPQLQELDLLDPCHYQGKRELVLDLLSRKPIYPALSGLSKLPVELFRNIAEFLDKQDIVSMRLVCSEIYHKMLPSYGEWCLETFQTDLTPESLQELKETSEDPRLNHFVRKLLIRKPRNRASLWLLPTGEHAEDPCRTGQYHTLRFILINLKNCHEFQLDSHCYHRYNDPPVWQDLMTPLQATFTILAAIAGSGILVKSFSSDLNEHCSTDVPGYGSLTVAPADGQLRSEVEFSQFEELSLDYVSTKHDLGWMSEILLPAAGLKRLSLSFTSRSNITDLISKIIEINSFPNLQELRLSTSDMEAIPITFEESIRFVLPFSSLRILDISKMWMRTPGTWSEFLKFVAKVCVRLETIAVSELWIETSSPFPRGCKLLFFNQFMTRPNTLKFKGLAQTKLQHQSRDLLAGISYSGSEMAEVLDLLIEYVLDNEKQEQSTE